MKKIKLLYIITKLELGGAQNHLLSLIGGLDKERFKIHLFTAKEGFLLPEVLTIPYLEIKKSSFLQRPVNPLKDILSLIELYRYIKKNNIEIVHTHSSKAGILGRLAARLARVKFIIHTVHGWSFNDYQPKVIRKLFIFLERLAGRFTDKIVVVSNYDKLKGLANNIGKPNKYSLIRYGINFDKFNKKEKNIKKELGIEFGDFVVTNISCFKPQKSCLDFVKTAYLVSQKLSDVKFLLVGDGILRKKIERLILKLNLGNRVILAGWRRDIPAVLSITDILTLTSLWEGLPIAALEAMAAGRPVVATDTGGIREIVRVGKTGFLVLPKNIKDMSDKLISLIKDGSLRARMSENSRIYLDEESRLNNMINKHQTLYDGLIKEEVNTTAN